MNNVQKGIDKQFIAVQHFHCHLSCCGLVMRASRVHTPSQHILSWHKSHAKTLDVQLRRSGKTRLQCVRELICLLGVACFFLMLV